MLLLHASQIVSGMKNMDQGKGDESKSFESLSSNSYTTSEPHTDIPLPIVQQFLDPFSFFKLP